MATQNIYALTDTWNSVGTTFTGIGLNVTDTTSATTSMLIDLQVGGTSEFHVLKNGAVHTKRSNYNITNTNAAAVLVSNYSLTGSGATSMFDLAGTWNTSGTPTALKLNVTDTASNAASALMDLQVGGVSQFKVSKAGAVTAVGVAIPTISSTDTLSNKTLSSPTLSGTVAGTPTYSGSPTYNARLIVNERNSDFKDTGFGGTSTGAWAAGRFYADAAYSGVIIQADTSQSADLFLVRNSTDTANLASINASGSFFSGGAISAHYTTAIPAGGTAGAGLMVSSTLGFGVFFGSGAPTLSAAKGSLYMRSDGSGINDRMYVNTDGSTTWTAVVTVA